MCGFWQRYSVHGHQKPSLGQMPHHRGRHLHHKANKRTTDVLHQPESAAVQIRCFSLCPARISKEQGLWVFIINEETTRVLLRFFTALLYRNTIILLSYQPHWRHAHAVCFFSDSLASADMWTDTVKPNLAPMMPIDMPRYRVVLRQCCIVWRSHETLVLSSLL